MIRELEFQDVEIVADGIAFPEGPVALNDGSIAFVEGTKGQICRVDAGGSLSVLAKPGGRPTGLAMGPGEALFVCNSGGESPAGSAGPSIQRVELETGRAATIYTECEGVALLGPNDIVFDSTGSFWFTDYRGGRVCYASADGSSIECPIKDASFPNGVGLSPDETVLYWAQTFTRQVLRRRLSAPGKVVPSVGCSVMSLFRNGTVDRDALLIGLPGAQELDSMAVENDGNVCVGTLVDSGITVISPEGDVVEKHVTPKEVSDGAVTNICFGGPDLQTAYITLSLTGRVVSCRWPRAGLRLPFQVVA
jgi:gluconolactonase